MVHPMSGMIPADDLQIFVAVARRSSFVEAARRLGVPTSTVSRRVAQLEEQLGVRLLQRTSRRVGLTQEGERLLERAAPLFEALAAAVDASDRAEEPAGRLRVTAPVLTGAQTIAPALFSFAARHPKITLELILTNSVLPLVEEGIDLAIRTGPIRDVELVARRLWSSTFTLAASRRFVRERLRGRARVERDALAGLPAVFSRPGGSWRLVGEDGTVDEVRPVERVTVNDPRMAIAAAIAGLGVVSAPTDALAQHGRSLVPLTVVGRTVEPRELYAVYPSRRLLPARVRLAIEWIKAHEARARPRVDGRAGRR
jgi:DNA-binding transcriptional LysR family regulator